MVTPWFYLMFVAILGAIPAYMAVDGKGPTASAESSDAEDDESTDSSTLLLPDDSAIASDSEDEDFQPSSKGKSQQSYGTMNGERN